jgi:hypothetical protein
VLLEWFIFSYDGVTTEGVLIGNWIFLNSYNCNYK